MVTKVYAARFYFTTEPTVVDKKLAMPLPFAKSKQTTNIVTTLQNVNDSGHRYV